MQRWRILIPMGFVILLGLMLGLFYLKKSRFQGGDPYPLVKDVGLGSPGKFQCELIGPEYREALDRFLRFQFYSCDNSLKAKKLPGDAREGKMGRVVFDGVTPVLFVLYHAKEGLLPGLSVLSPRKKIPQVFNSVIFDLNGDEDLSNDPRFTGFKGPESSPINLGGYQVDFGGYQEGEAEFQLPNGTTHHLPLALGTNSLRVKTDFWLRGKTLFEGKEVEAAILNQTPLGIGPQCPERSAFLLLDVNGNGKFDFDPPYTFRKTGPEVFLLQTGVSIQGVLYDARFDTPKMELILTRSTIPQGKLDLKPNFACQIKSWEVSISYLDSKKQSTPTEFYGTDKDFPISLESCNSLSMHATLFLVTESNKMYVTEFVVESVPVEEGKTTILPIGQIKSFEMTLDQIGGPLVINRTLLGENNVSYSRVLPFSETSPKDPNSPDMSGPSMGRLVFYDAQGKQIGEDTTTFGLGGIDQSFWEIPKTLGKGEKIKVLLTWETELFGKLEAEKEIILEGITPVP